MDSSSSSNSQPESPEDANDRLTDSSPETTAQSTRNTENAKDSETISGNSTLERRLNIEGPASPPRMDSGLSPMADEDFQNLVDMLSEASSTYTHFHEPARRYSPYPVHHQLFLQQHQEQERRRYSLAAAGSSRITPRSSSYRYRLARFSLTESAHINSVRRVISFIDNLTTRKNATDHDSTEKCVICISNYVANEELRELRCTHKFHRMCIDEWLVKSSLCPVCRTDLGGPGHAGWEAFGAAPTRELNFDMILNDPDLHTENETEPESVPSPSTVTKE